MEFGLQFFPNNGPDQISAQDYWSDALALCGICDELGFASIRTVEHYFHAYGGYSPSPLVFLAAAARHTRRARLITGAVLPVFNHPLKLAAEIALVDAISEGRLEVGLARAFLPREFGHFGISMDESRARFEEGVEQVRLLLTEEHASHEGRFHRFRDVTSMPRPTQRPHPPFWIAATSAPETFTMAGRLGYNIMAIPFASERLRDLIALYRDTWRAAGHPGAGKIMLGFHMFCDEDRGRAHDMAREPVNAYFRAVVAGAAQWATGTTSKDYVGYDKMVAALSRENFDTQLAGRTAWVGTPADIADAIGYWRDAAGGFEVSSMQVNFDMIPLDAAQRSMRLFAAEVMPRVR